MQILKIAKLEIMPSKSLLPFFIFCELDAELWDGIRKLPMLSASQTLSFLFGQVVGVRLDSNKQPGQKGMASLITTTLKLSVGNIDLDSFLLLLRSRLC